MKVREAAQAAAAGDQLRAALAETDPATRAAALDDIAASGSRAAVLARLAQAGSKADAGDTAGAATLLAGIADDGGVGELYRSLASLERVMVLGKAMDAAERAATLDLLAAQDAPFRPLALEQRALMHLDAGDKAAALTDLQALLTEPNATDALKARARQLIIAAGGTVPVPVPVSPSADG